MDDLEPQDLMHLDVAEGWLGFGHVIEAEKELRQISLAMQRHPVVLEVRWNMWAKAECWDDCVKIAQELIDLMPDNTFGWIHRSYALHEQDLTGTARMYLLPAVARFPDDITIRYNLACYECVLGNMEEAKLHLTAAFNLALQQDCAQEWKEQMLGDEDLKPLWGIWDEDEI